MTSYPTPVLLYVEDEIIVSMVVVESLEDAGFQVQHVLDGAAAVSALEDPARQVVALVTDVRLPKMDGWEIARRARELSPALPVVYATADSAVDWSAKGVPNSIVVEKPFASAQLVAAVTTLLNQATPPQPR